MNETVSLLVVLVLLALVVVVFIRVSLSLRRGGGSLTTTVLGATDAFLAQERRKAAETIVNENAGKRFAQIPSTGPRDA